MIKFPVSVEAIQMALPLVTRRLKYLGLNPVLRPAHYGTGPWITDEGLLAFIGWR